MDEVDKLTKKRNYYFLILKVFESVPQLGKCFVFGRVLVKKLFLLELLLAHFSIMPHYDMQGIER